MNYFILLLIVFLNNKNIINCNDSKQLFNLKSSEREESIKDTKTTTVNKLTRKLPIAIIIGSKKSGTRALLNFIGVHPNVTTAGAEVHFFDKYYDKGFEWYRNKMPLSNENQITIEKTPKYFIDPQVPKRVYNMNKKIKLVIVLRNPVTRAISDYTQSLEKSSVYNNSSINKFENMLFDSNGEIRTNWPIVRNGLYYIHLRNWLKYFPLNQIHFVNGEELIKNPFNEIKKVEEFLNLKPVIQEKHFIYNLRKGFPCIMKPLDSGIIRCLNEKKGRKHPVVPDSALNKLNEFYKPYSESLFKKIKQKPFWPI